MTGQKKVAAALSHKEAPVPIDFGSTPVTGIHVELLERIRRYYGLKSKPVELLDPFQMLGRIDDDLKSVTGIDTDSVEGPYTLFGFKLEKWKTWTTPWGQEILVPELFNTTTGTDGTIYLYPEGDLTVQPSGRMPAAGYYFDTIVRQEPIEESRLRPEDNLEEFPIIGQEILDYFLAQAKTKAETNRFLVGTFTGDTGLGDIARVPGPMLKHPKGIRDETEWYISTVSRQEYLHRVFAEQTDRALKNLKMVHEAVGDAVGALFICGTDFGTQESLFCSAETFDSLYKPYYRKVNDWIHSHTNWKTFKHSCGAIEPLIPHLIEAGFDILNPVQTTAAGMDPHVLKAKYGRDIVFWGGGIDTQKTLPFGTKEEVRSAVLRNLECFAREGGYVFNAIHNVQAKVPVENFVAMIDAVNEFNGN